MLFWQVWDQLTHEASEAVGQMSALVPNLERTEDEMMIKSIQADIAARLLLAVF
jgi:hypothetical protein